MIRPRAASAAPAASSEVSLTPGHRSSPGDRLRTLSSVGTALPPAAAIAIAIPALGIFGIDVGVMVIASVAVVQFWFMFLGVYLMFRKYKV